MSGHTRLYRRGATYYHRASIPVDIQDTYPKTEETFSLKTKDYKEALRQVRIASVAVDKRFDEHRRLQVLAAAPAVSSLSPEQIKHIGELYHAYLLEEDDDTRAEGFYRADDPYLRELPAPSFEEYRDDNDWLEEQARELYAQARSDTIYRSEAEEVLTWDGVEISLEAGSPSWRPLELEIIKASIRARGDIARRNQGDPIETPVVPDQTSLSSASSPLLGALIEKWVAEKNQAGTWRPKTADAYHKGLLGFLECCGDRPVTSYGKKDARQFKEVLMGLPANWNKHKALRNLDIVSASQKAHELGLQPQSVTNINKILGFVNTFWRWTAANYDDVCSVDTFSNMKLPRSKRKKEDRDTFTAEELGKIFNAPIYRGCRSVKHWKQPGNFLPKDRGIFWLPLLGLFTGARSGELIQLRRNDIKKQEGIWYIDINEDQEGNHVKNQNSIRTIPLHQTLIDCGFLKFIQGVSGEDRLFPEMKRGADGYYSSVYSKHFGRFLKSIGVKQRKNSFHSLRHNFKDAGRNGGADMLVIDVMQGHLESGMRETYKGEGYNIASRKRELDKVKYGGLSLDHLRSL